MTLVSRAVHSSGLVDRAQRIGDTDVLRALAGVSLSCMRYRPGGRGARREANHLGVAYLEAYQGAAGDGADGVRMIRELDGEILRVVEHKDRFHHHVARPLFMARRVTRELILDRCPVCQGRGYLPIRRYETDTEHHGIKDCTECLGTGLPVVRHQARMRAAGVERRIYHHYVAGLYVSVMAECGSAMADALLALSKRLRLDLNAVVDEL